MSATEIIDEIKQLPMNGQREVIEFAYRFDAERMLTGEEIGTLVQRMVDATDPTEVLRWRDAALRGFYGGKADA